MKLLVSTLVVISIFISGCTKDIERYQSPYVKDKDEESVDVKLPSHWVEHSGSMKDIGFHVYRSERVFNNKKTRLIALVFNPSKVEFKPVISSSAKTVSQFYASEQGVIASVNGGYFGAGTSYSLILQNGVNLADNIRSLSRAYNGSNTPYYPTRAAFGLDISNKPSVAWVYSLTSKGAIYSYPTPSPNIEGQVPQAVPSASFPSGGQVWGMDQAIGGSPMLIKDGKINITDKEELISVDNTANRPRTAIGYYDNGFITLLVAEGGNTAETIPGLTLNDVANIMLDMGCEGAINLDGGGSSMMVVNGEKQIRPSDAAGERAVISAVLIKKK
ncbi:phosphodiester glycosidase family protein [Sphingobacterium bovistauri]|uniref:Phosphodiester glycosidase family protein n=1 Tax=Sphingobacterium bovistauri TaxID=2781959 RepID=A0ABS7Z2J4_9SPHI|nr:phosphodiester glycosidase family protein [Sphingobacterium bovistauri]MCA5004378.1 phosphodiester glycosidase family protein [Sphingobacterium bovistauri]